MDDLGLCIICLKPPVTFEQMDRSLLGWGAATHLTESIHLEIGNHRETIQFIVIKKMIEPIILGLVWLDKGGGLQYGGKVDTGNYS